MIPGLDQGVLSHSSSTRCGWHALEASEALHCKDQVRHSSSLVHPFATSHGEYQNAAVDVAREGMPPSHAKGKGCNVMSLVKAPT